MRRNLPQLLSAAFVLIATSSLFAQHDHFAYAITDVSKQGAGWNVLRKLDLETGQYSDVLLNGTDQNFTVYDAVSKKQLTIQPDAKYGNSLRAPFSTGVAAAAYDKKHNRLYFTPMFIDQLRYLDLSNMKMYYVTSAFTQMGNMHNDEAKIITRMVIAPDGNGYAISNDGNTFIRFSTGKKPNIVQLGALVDDASNNNTSIHNRCSSFGGDMIADDKGNLFILSARNHVFKVNVETKVTTFLGVIKNLPSNFTVNGAVVDADGSLLVSSAVDNSAYYIVNPKSWIAAPLQLANGVYRSSDLANSNFLSTRPQVIKPELQNVQLTRTPAADKFAKRISVYPNPVTNDNITMQFNKVPNGDYVIELTDVLGRSVLQKRITINNEDQTHSLSISRNSARGTYLVKVFDKESQSVFTKNVLVQ
ncbi:MAG: T9SS type A sorting domain-containing protein [Flavisolibacter sp.]